MSIQVTNNVDEFEIDRILKTSKQVDSKIVKKWIKSYRSALKNKQYLIQQAINKINEMNEELIELREEE